MLHACEAILLDVVDLHEHDRIVTLLTAERGKVRGVARGARRKYSRFAGNLQPLAKVSVSWFHKEGRDLARLTGVEMVRPAERLQRDLEGILLGSCLAGQVLEFAQENEPSHHLFRLADSTLEALLDGVDRNLAMRYFEFWVLRLAGVVPVPGECPVSGRVLGPEGAAVPPSGEGFLHPTVAPPGSLAVGQEAVGFLRRLGRESLRQAALTPPSVAALEEIEAACGRMRRAFLQHEVKSYQVMQEVLAACAPSRT
jgi:DNA repair protein RecO (recombination protein O)